MGVLLRNEDFVGGIDSSLVSKIGTTPLTTTAQDLSSAINEHESDIISIINNKADKSTTLDGYGITDANISNGIITLGSNTITPLTSHQTVTDNNPTLSWGTKSKVATIGNTEINVTMPSNPNTNTTYTIATGDANGQIKVTPSSSSAYNVSVKGLGTAAYTASTAYAAASHTHSYLPLSGGTLTGLLKITLNSNTVTIGSQNTSYCHFMNSANIPFYFNKKISVDGDITTTGEIFQSGSSKNLQLVSGGDGKTIYLRGGSIEGKKVTTLTGYIPFYGSSFTNPSSRRIKENIIDLSEDEAKKILNINPVKFDFIEDYGGDKDQYGVIAEDVLDTIPFVVTKDDNYKEDEPLGQNNRPLSVDYSKFVPFLIKMIQMQQTEINELKSELTILKNNFGDK